MWRLMNQAEQELMPVTVMATRRNKGNENKLDGMAQYVITRFYMFPDQESQLEKYCGRILSSRR